MDIEGIYKEGRRDGIETESGSFSPDWANSKAKKAADAIAENQSFLKEGLHFNDKLFIEGEEWAVCSMGTTGGVKTSYRLARLTDDHRMTLPVSVVVGLIKGGATVVLAGGE